MSAVNWTLYSMNHPKYDGMRVAYFKLAGRSLAVYGEWQAKYDACVAEADAWSAKLGIGKAMVDECRIEGFQASDPLPEGWRVHRRAHWVMVPKVSTKAGKALEAAIADLNSRRPRSLFNTDGFLPEDTRWCVQSGAVLLSNYVGLALTDPPVVHSVFPSDGEPVAPLDAEPILVSEYWALVEAAERKAGASEAPC